LLIGATVMTPEKIKPVPGKTQLTLKGPAQVDAVDQRRLYGVGGSIAEDTPADHDKVRGL
jgi:hypothetical protein